jgi:hypothetical protein
MKCPGLPFPGSHEERFYGEWELGTYWGSWRVVREGVVVCGNTEIVDSIDQLDDLLRSIVLGRLEALRVLSCFDIQLVFENETHIDILATASEDDELFHIFGPGHTFVEYRVPGFWKSGKSNAPWK